MFDLKCGDCLKLLSDIPDHSIDLIVCDLPYGSTSCDWDSPIDLLVLWEHYKRIIKPYSPILFTASQPFTTTVAASNLAWLKYEWIWVKNRPTNPAHAKNKPMKRHENILVFSEGTTVHQTQSVRRMPYFPQAQKIAVKRIIRQQSELTDAFFPARPGHGEFVRDATGYPNSILEYDTDQLGLHPTAKPIALIEFLIKTYTRVGDIVLDPCVGSGTSGVAAMKCDRSFIGIEMDAVYYDIALSRIRDAEQERKRVIDDPVITFGELIM